MPIESHTFMGSSNIASAEYDADALVLGVTFHNGRVYQYLPVPPQTWTEFINAPSAGKFFASNIRNQFDAQEI